MSAAHTPGPWSYRKNYDGSLDFFAEGGARVILCNARLVNQKSNADLIAAAPDLLEALKLALENVSPAYPSDHLVVKQARAAIAKATGEQ